VICYNCQSDTNYFQCYSKYTLLQQYFLNIKVFLFLKITRNISMIYEKGLDLLKECQYCLTHLKISCSNSHNVLRIVSSLFYRTFVLNYIIFYFDKQWQFDWHFLLYLFKIVLSTLI
jgi:hypothetical protein